MTGRESPFQDRSSVWIPAVPLPLQGWRTDRCSCGEKFRGKDRRKAYELHWRRVHERDDLSDNHPQMAVSHVEAMLLYEHVNADRAPGPTERAV